MYLLIALAILVPFLILRFAYVNTPKRQAVIARQCTKHMITRPIPGGPEHLVWVYGPHRTKGNKCDGPEHKRAMLGGWW